MSYDDASVRPEVLAQVARLSLRQRAVVTLTYWDDLDQRAVAERLGISAGSVRRHLARAHAKLRRLLDDA
jgi:RNA polymerase sigma factor (sigma-70 family)